MAAIDPSARVESGAVLGRDVSVGPYCIIGPDVVVGDGCRLIGHVHLTGHTTHRCRAASFTRSSRSARRRSRSNIAAVRPGS